MGKANRIKSERAMDTLSTPMAKKKTKKSMPAWLGTTIVVVVLLALVVTAAFFALDKSGTFKRMRVVMGTENFEVTVPMMSYMVQTEFQSLVSTYDSYSEQFGVTISIPGGKGGTALDTSKPLREQIYATQNSEGKELATPQTWFDHFVEMATADIKQLLAVCEAAKANGVALEQADFDSIDVTMQTTAIYAAYYGYTTDGYLSALYGEGVTEKDVRAMMEISSLAAKYNELKSEEFNNGVTDDEVNTEYENNNLGDKENKYDVFIDYIGYTFNANFVASTNTNTDKAKEENEKNAAKYEAQQKKYKALAEELKKAAEENPDTFVDKLRATLQELFFEEEQETARSKKTGDNPTLTESEIQACRTAADQRAAQAAVDAIVKNADTTSSSMNSDLKDWLNKKDDPRKAGDVMKDVSEYDAFGNEKTDKEDDTKTPSTTYKSSNSSYSVYLTTGGLHKNEGVVRSVAHILFKTATYKDVKSSENFSGVIKVLADRVLKKNEKLSAELMAKELLALMLEEGKLTTKTVNGKTYYVMDEQVFKAYGEQYTEDGGVFYDDVAVGEMVSEFEDWMFSDARIEGEVSYPSAVETDYGFHIMMYRGDEKPAWSHSIRTSLAEGRYDEWLENLTENVKLVKNNAANESYINMLPETIK